MDNAADKGPWHGKDTKSGSSERSLDVEEVALPIDAKDVGVGPSRVHGLLNRHSRPSIAPEDPLDVCDAEGSVVGLGVPLVRVLGVGAGEVLEERSMVWSLGIADGRDDGEQRLAGRRRAPEESHGRGRAVDLVDAERAVASLEGSRPLTSGRDREERLVGRIDGSTRFEIRGVEGKDFED